MSFENNMINIKDLDVEIFRIYTITRFKEMIKNQKNGLVRPSMWDDPFENFFLKNEAITDDGEVVSLSSIAESWYGQCWTKNKDSDAMWRIYSPEKNGIRLGTTIRKLFTNFYDMTNEYASLKYLIGEVEYADQSVIEDFLTTTTFTNLAMGGQPHNFAKTLLTKRIEFDHEREVRLLFNDSNGEYKTDKVVNFPFPVNQIISSIALDPRLDKNEYDKQKQEIIDLGCSIPIIQSPLYKFQPIQIKL